MLLRAHGLVVGWGGRAILPALDFAVGAGELWAVLGPNGGGKSTLLRTLLGLQPPVRGTVERSTSASPAYVSQRHELDATVPARVIDVVRWGLEQRLSFLRPTLARGQRQRVHELMAQTGVTELAQTQFRLLSEGQKQRVLLARALVSAPNLVALDEPTSAMDAAAERDTFALIDELRSRHPFTVVVITHDLHHLEGRATHAVIVDKDRGLAHADAFAAVTSSPHFVERYGSLGPSPRAGAIAEAAPAPGAS